MEETRGIGVSYWASQSPVTDPGNAATAIGELPADISVLRRASSQMIFHYRAGGDFAENGVPAERMAEIDTRYADALLGLLLQRGDPALDRDRPPSERAVGCCRDATVLFLALARTKGMPARARVGFAAYLTPGWLIDHVVAEVWDEAAGRWRTVDPEMDTAWTPKVNGIPVNWLDLTDDQFVTGPRAWQAARAGISDPGRHVVTPGLDIPATRGWPEIAHHVVHDLAALNKTEMLVWDSWGLLDAAWAGPSPWAGPSSRDNALTDEISAVIDEISAVTADPAADRETLARIGARDGLRVPPVVTSMDPNGGPPRRADVSRAVAIRPSRHDRRPPGVEPAP
jgi:transglutaminase superfamily protein